MGTIPMLYDLMDGFKMIPIPCNVEDDHFGHRRRVRRGYELDRYARDTRPRPRVCVDPHANVEHVTYTLDLECPSPCRRFPHMINVLRDGPTIMNILGREEPEYLVKTHRLPENGVGGDIVRDHAAQMVARTILCKRGHRIE